MSDESVNTIITDAARELGLTTSDITLPSTDANIQRLASLLTSVGRELVRAHPWSVLQTEYTFSTQNGVDLYALPSSFVRMLDQTNWNRTTAYPMESVGAEVWQYVNATATTPLFLSFRLYGASAVRVLPTPTATETVAFEYQSNGWTSNSNGDAVDRVDPAFGTGNVYLDSLLVMRGLKLAWLNSMKLPADSEQEDYLRTLDMVKAQDGGANRMRLDRVRPSILVDQRNIPDGGYGS